MKSKFSMSCGEWGMFLLRVVLGAVFIAHGVDKLQHMQGVIGFFSGMLHIPAFLAYVVTWTELLSGVAMLLGAFTRVAGYLITIVMIVAIWLAKFKVGFLGGYELDLTLLAAALAIAWNGPGKLSLANKMCGCGKCMLCGGELMKKAAKTCDNCDMCKDGCKMHE